jgi:hypothetical protein
MVAAERPTGGETEQQVIVRYAGQLQALVRAMRDGNPVDFRAIHSVASQITQAAYEGWKKAALAEITPRGRDRDGESRRP